MASPGGGGFGGGRGERRRAKGAAVSLGQLMPGRRCDLCGALLVFAAIATPSGGVFCPSHQSLASCLCCGAPFEGDGGLCRRCAATAINTQQQVRTALPRARLVLHTMGIKLEPPAHVRLVDPGQLQHTGEQGRVVGRTVILGRQVTEILVASGQPEVQFGATVAHEAMHAWLVQNGFPLLDPKLEEGLCQTVSYRWLRDQADPLTAGLRQAIDDSPDPVYGDGFRMVKAAVKQHGMNNVLATVKATGRLP